MAIQEHSIAPGFNNAGAYVNFEVYFAAPFAGDRVPLGAVVSNAGDGTRVHDGDQRVFLRTGGCAWSELNAYVTAVHSSWDGAETVEVTLRCLKRNNTYDDFNAIAFMPVEGTHFTRGLINEVIGLELEYLIIAEAS